MQRNQRQTCRNTSNFGFTNDFPLIPNDLKRQSMQDFVAINFKDNDRY